ncbi:MAG TPA: hypothetical protein PKG95_14445, partial [Anaerolineaceae bacterium]|nr:hypothetical protein [Anaerolineaceae bacterium]
MKQLSVGLQRRLQNAFHMLVALGLLLMLLGISPQPAQAAVNCAAPGVVCVGGTISTDTTWGPGYVYVVQSHLIVA